MSKPKVAVVFPYNQQQRVMNNAVFAKLGEIANFIRNPHPRTLLAEELGTLIGDADAIISGWGGGQLSADVLAQTPNLKMVAYSAGSVRPVISDAFWERNILLTSAAAAIAVDVAETTLALMIMSRKKIWQYAMHTRRGGWKDTDKVGPSREMNGATIGLIGFGLVGRQVMRVLQPLDCKVLVADPYVDEAKVGALGAKKVDLPDLLAQADIVSLHAPATPQTRHMINAPMLRLMKNDAIFINTSRGVLVDETALIAELQTGRIFACIDVTDPEPPTQYSALRHLENVLLTPHIAGPVSNCTRQGFMAVEEVRRFFAGEEAMYPISRQQAEAMT